VQHFNAVGEQLAAFKLRLWYLRRWGRRRLHCKPPKPPILLRALRQGAAQSQFQPVEMVPSHKTPPATQGRRLA
jgi:hypothetical protein